MFDSNIWGRWLPFIGWKTFPCTSEGNPIPYVLDDEGIPVIDADAPEPVGERSYFVAAWLDHSIIFGYVRLP